jgi:hypothetical protein
MQDSLQLVMNVEKAINKRFSRTTLPTQSMDGELCILHRNSLSPKNLSASRVPTSQPINALKEE